MVLRMLLSNAELYSRDDSRATVGTGTKAKALVQRRQHINNTNRDAIVSDYNQVSQLDDCCFMQPSTTVNPGCRERRKYPWICARKQKKRTAVWGRIAVVLWWQYCDAIAERPVTSHNNYIYDP